MPVESGENMASGEQSEFGKPHMVEHSVFQTKYPDSSPPEVLSAALNRTADRQSTNEIISSRRICEKSHAALVSHMLTPTIGGRRVSAPRSLRRAPRFERAHANVRERHRGSGSPPLGRSNPSRHCISSRRRHEKPLRSSALGRGPKVGTGQPSVRRPLRERRARRRTAW